ncbi:hypothetical protein QGM71_20265 [Virgibacillus sp. C22-A2]|uniref:Uncharacterized protein n=1 Tax=Virgibacillus tibetensis TaxID=3042313 RepID=A0ABU6KKG6_9BACI|nr:hypothetical protein [Virgibacillus sp. C22-A2]
MHFHIDIYKSIVNDRMEQLKKEACQNRIVTKTNHAIDKKKKKYMIFRSFFQAGKG